MKSELFGCPTARAEGGMGEEPHIGRIYGDVPPKWMDFTKKKSVNMGPILKPQKIPKLGSNLLKIG